MSFPDDNLTRKPYVHKIIRNKIGFDAKRAFNNATGLGNYSRYIIETAATAFGRHATYYLYTPSIKKEQSYWTQGFKQFRIIRPPYLRKLIGAAWRSFLGERVLKDQINIFHGLSNELPFNIKNKCRVSIVTIHDLIFMHHPETYKFIDRVIYYLKFKYACRVADIIIATSENTKKDLIKYLKADEKKIRVLYQDTSIDYYYPPVEDDARRIMEKYKVEGPYMICVSAFQKRKNHLRLIEAFAAAQPIPHKLLLVGAGGELLEDVKKLIEEKGISDKVQILQYVKGSHLPTLYYNADFAAYPSIYEGFGIPLLEAMRMRVPMITNKDGCFREVSGEAALYVDVTKVEEITESIKALSGNEALRKELQAKADIELKRFDPTALREKLRALYFPYLDF